jgi:hypothetical protein
VARGEEQQGARVHEEQWCQAVEGPGRDHPQVIGRWSRIEGRQVVSSLDPCSPCAGAGQRASQGEVRVGEESLGSESTLAVTVVAGRREPASRLVGRTRPRRCVVEQVVPVRVTPHERPGRRPSEGAVRGPGHVGMANAAAAGPGARPWMGPG